MSGPTAVQPKDLKKSSTLDLHCFAFSQRTPGLSHFTRHWETTIVIYLNSSQLSSGLGFTIANAMIGTQSTLF